MRDAVGWRELGVEVVVVVSCGGLEGGGGVGGGGGCGGGWGWVGGRPHTDPGGWFSSNPRPRGLSACLILSFSPPPPPPQKKKENEFQNEFKIDFLLCCFSDVTLYSQ